MCNDQNRKAALNEPITHHNNMTYYRYDTHTAAAQERFDKKYIPTDSGCWQWQSPVDTDGYGQFTLNFEGKKYMLRAHRYSWIVANKQDWPSDKPVARHLCNNPSCVNPNHIVPGTAKENAADAIAAGTHYRGTNATKRAVITPLGEFESGSAAARAHGMRYTHLIHLLKTNKDYRYI